MLIDFDKGEEMLNKFAGSEAKTTILYENEVYMIKYPNPVDFKNQEFNRVSCYYMNNKKVYYHDIFTNPPEALADAILRIASKINMVEIHGIVDSTPCISDIRKEYLKKALDLRFNEIILPTLKRIKSRL